MEQPDQQQNFEARDASTAVILGTFFVILAIPVLIGTLYAKLSVDRVINGVSGLAVLLVGVLFILRGRYDQRKIRGDVLSPQEIVNSGGMIGPIIGAILGSMTMIETEGRLVDQLSIVLIWTAMGWAAGSAAGMIINWNRDGRSARDS